MKKGVINDWTSKVSVEKEFLTQKISMDDDPNIKDEMLRYMIEHYITAKEAEEIIGEFYSDSKMRFLSLEEMVENGCVELDLSIENLGKTLFYHKGYKNVRSDEDYEKLTEKEQVDFQIHSIEVFTLQEYEFLKKLLKRKPSCYSYEFFDCCNQKMLEVYFSSNYSIVVPASLEGIVYELV